MSDESDVMVMDAGIKRIPVEDQIKAGRRFLQKFGIDASKLTDEDVVDKLEKIREAKAKSVEVLSKGPTLDGMERLLQKYIPEGFRGEFKLNNEIDIPRAEAMGWEIVRDKRAKKDTPTASADDKVVLGDTVLMMMPEEQYIANTLVKLERVEANRRLSRPSKSRDETSEWAVPVVEL